MASSSGTGGDIGIKKSNSLKPGEISNYLLKIFAYLLFTVGLRSFYYLFQEASDVYVTNAISAKVQTKLYLYAWSSLVLGLMMFSLFSVIASIYDKLHSEGKGL